MPGPPECDCELTRLPPLALVMMAQMVGDGLLGETSSPQLRDRKSIGRRRKNRPPPRLFVDEPLALASAFACAVTTQSSDEGDWVARKGHYSLFNIYRRTIPQVCKQNCVQAAISLENWDRRVTLALGGTPSKAR